MTTPAFHGQIAIFAFEPVPRGWAQCAGQLLPINQNQALFSLLATTYGGDGRTSFALPDLRGRVPIAFGNGFAQGERGGEEMHTLTNPEMASHQHNLMADAGASSTGNQPSPQTVLGPSSGRVNPGGPTFSANLYASGNPTTALSDKAIAPIGSGQGHENRMPSLALAFCICIDPQAQFPPRG
jgi:microcystin-dependent protein